VVQPKLSQRSHVEKNHYLLDEPKNFLNRLHIASFGLMPLWKQQRHNRMMVERWQFLC
jgi:hypothetical protein